MNEEKLKLLKEQAQEAEDLFAIIHNDKFVTYGDMFKNNLVDLFPKASLDDIKKIVIANMNKLNGGITPIPQDVFNKLVEEEKKLRKEVGGE